MSILFINGSPNKNGNTAHLVVSVSKEGISTEWMETAEGENRSKEVYHE